MKQLKQWKFILAGTLAVVYSALPPSTFAGRDPIQLDSKVVLIEPVNSPRYPEFGDRPYPACYEKFLPRQTVEVWAKLDDIEAEKINKGHKSATEIAEAATLMEEYQSVEKSLEFNYAHKLKLLKKAANKGSELAIYKLLEKNASANELERYAKLVKKYIKEGSAVAVWHLKRKQDNSPRIENALQGIPVDHIYYQIIKVKEENYTSESPRSPRSPRTRTETLISSPRKEVLSF